MRAPSHRLAAAGAHAATDLPEARKGPRWTTHGALSILDLDPGRIDPWGAGLANPGDPPAAEQSSGDPPPPLPRAKHLGHPIRSQRPRLDLGSFKSERQDLDLTADILRYRFGLDFLLKRPWVSFK